MKILTLNLNGIRSATQKGFFNWLQTRTDIDVVCLQEIRNHTVVSESVYQIPGYENYFLPAQKPGYSGVAIYTRMQSEQVNISFGWSLADHEGRYLQIDFPQCSIASCYFPSGTSSEERQKIKMEFLDHFANYLQQLAKLNRSIILCGDFNIAHKTIDLKNWRANQKHPGFLPEERAWLDYIFDELGWIDAFRLINQEPDQYTWWSARGNAYAKNVGWRIDYQIISPDLASSVKSVEIYKEQRFSDHAPLIIEYDFKLC